MKPGIAEPDEIERIRTASERGLEEYLRDLRTLVDIDCGTYLPDGKHVITVFSSGTGVDWNVDPRAWKKDACRVGHRNLTPAEWRDLLPERGYRAFCP